MSPSPDFSPRREARARRCLKMQGARESEAERREGPVDLRAAERARHGWGALACERCRECEATQARGGVLDSTLRTFSERNAADSGGYVAAAVMR